MGVLQDISRLDENIQRIRMCDCVNWKLSRKGDFLFFPEIILCVALHQSDSEAPEVAEFWEAEAKANQARDTIRLGSFVFVGQQIAKKRYPCGGSKLALQFEAI
jgi:hypothetical protein